MTINPKELEQVLLFLKKCKKLGLVSIKIGEIQAVFADFEQKSDTRLPRSNASSGASAIKLDDGMDTNRDEEFELSQLRINDPLAFEEYEIKRVARNGGTG